MESDIILQSMHLPGVSRFFITKMGKREKGMFILCILSLVLWVVWYGET